MEEMERNMSGLISDRDSVIGQLEFKQTEMAAKVA
jgi:hypothetical protein